MSNVIRVFGDAKINCYNEDEDEFYVNPYKFDNLQTNSNLVEYFHKAEQELLPDVTGGDTRFYVENDQLFVETIYYSNEKLNETQLECLKEYTQGQWSDGWGEGFEQRPVCRKNWRDVYISPWHVDQKINISQSKTSD
mgnify:CR=1 FL=1